MTTPNYPSAKEIDTELRKKFETNADYVTLKSTILRNEYATEKLIKVKLVYQKPYKRSRLAKENNVNQINNTISVNQTVQRSSKRRILFDKRKNEDNENIKGNPIRQHEQ